MAAPTEDDFKSFVASQQPDSTAPASQSQTPAPITAPAPVLSAAPTADDFKQFAQSDSAQTPAEKLVPAVNAGAAIAPAAAAQAISLNRKTGLPEDFILRNPDTVAQHAKNLEKDPATFARQYPVTADYMGDSPTHSAVVGNDLHSLMQYEDQFSDHHLLGQITNKLKLVSDATTNLFIKSPLAGLASLGKTATMIPVAINAMGRASRAGQLPPELEDLYQKNLVENPATVFLDEKQKALSNPDLDADTLDLIHKGNYARAGLHLANQLTNMAPMSLAMLFGGHLAAGAVAAGAAGEAADQAQKAGVSPENVALNAVGKGTVMALANEVTLGLMKGFGGLIAKKAGTEASKQVLRSFWQAMAHNVATDATSFTLMRAGDDFIDYASGVNPDALKDERHKLLNEAITGAMMGAVAGAPRAKAEGAHKAQVEAQTASEAQQAGQAGQAPAEAPKPKMALSLPDMPQKMSAVRQAEADRDLYTGLGKTAEQSKLKSLSPEAHREVIEKMASNLSPTLDLQGAEQYFQSQNIEPLRAFTDLGLGKQYEEAKSIGLPEIKVPMGEWMDKVAGTAHYEPLGEHFKFNADEGSMTPMQATEFKKSMETLADRPEVKEDSTDAQKNSVFHKTYRELIKFYSDAQAKTYAQRDAKILEHIGGGALVGKRLTPEELLERFPRETVGTGKRRGKGKPEVTNSNPASFDFGANAPFEAAKKAMQEPPEEHTDLTPDDLKDIQEDQLKKATVESGGLTPLLNAIRANGKLSWEKVLASNRGQELRELNHLRIFDKNGLQPDIMANELHAAGHLGEPDMDKMIDQIIDESKKLADAKTEKGEKWVKSVQTASRLNQMPDDFERNPAHNTEEHLTAKWDDHLTPEERIHEYYRHDVSGALNENGFNHLKADPAKPKVAFLNIDKKFVNDKMGHEAGDKILRMVAQAALTVDPEAAVIKGNLALRVKDEAHAKELVNQINAALPERVSLADKDGNEKVYNAKAFKVDGAVGDNLEAADQAWGSHQQRLRDAGQLAPRGEAPKEFKETGGQESPEVAGRDGLGKVAPEMVEALKGAPNEDIFKKAWINPISGLPNKAGFNALPQKAFRGVMDVDKMGVINELLGKEAGDTVLKQVGLRAKEMLAAARLSGFSDDLAHVSGDEFYVNSDDPAKAHEFCLALRNILDNTRFNVRGDDGKDYILKGVGVSFGIGDNHDAAEEGLKADKNRGGGSTIDSVAGRIRSADEGGGRGPEEGQTPVSIKLRSENLRSKLDRAAMQRRHQEEFGSGQSVPGNEPGPVQTAQSGILPEFSSLTLNQTPDEGQRPVAPAFYSKLQKTIDQKLGSSATVDQIKGLLKDVSADERKWSGIDDFLKDKEKVSKPELLDFLRANQLQIREVTKGDEAQQEEVKKYEAEVERRMQEEGPDADRNEIEHQVGEEMQEKTEPKYAEHTLPGGENYKETLLALPEKFNTAKDFNAGHFSEANVLAHVRTTDRTDAEGKKVLMVEEVQSDWHQQGRKSGYQGEVRGKEQIRKEMNEVDRRRLELENLGSKATTEEKQEWADLSNRFRDLIKEYDNVNNKAVPDAPFKKTWHEFALKRMLREAAEKGYDKLAWTTGEQQAERYNLAKYVDKIFAKKVGDRYALTVDGKNGELIHDSRIEDTAENLPNIVGKDMAQKIVDDLKDEGDTKTYSGLDLKVGGEGMKGFYDKMIPDYLNKFGKKFGAKVGESTLPVDESKVEEVDPYQTENFTSPEVPEQITVHSIDITPAMRKTALEEGFPMFQGKDHYGPGEPTGSINIHRDEEGGFAGARIQMPPNANLTTWVHESFHYYLEVMKELAKDPNASPQLLKDMAALKDWERGNFLKDPELFTKKYANQVLEAGKAKDANPLMQADAQQLKAFAGLAAGGVDEKKLAAALKKFEETGQAPAGMQDMFAKLRDRMLHEAGAEGFEKYALEGKAPTEDLKGAFARIRAWMLSVYKKGKAYISQPLNGEVRDFFDRLVAGQDALEEARGQQGFHAYFPKPEALGLDPKETQEYADLIDQTNREAQDKMARSAIAKAKREQSKEYKDSLEENRRAAAEIADGLPHVRARSILETGKMPDGKDPVEPLKGLKLDKAALLAEFPERAKQLEAAGLLDKITGAQGQHPDQAAGLLGFGSGDELLHWVADPASDPTSWIEKMAQYRQGLQDNRRSDADIAEEALDALYNEKASAVIEKEMKLLAGNKLAALKLGAMVAHAVPDLRTIKAQAYDAIETKVDAGQLLGGKANQYAKASATAGKNAIKAILDGNQSAAFKAKAMQLKTAELYRAASEAKKEIGKIKDMMDRLKTAATRDRIGKAGTGEGPGLGYLPQIDAIMERFGFKRPQAALPEGEQATPGRRTLAGWVAAMQDKEGYPITFDPMVMDEGISKNWKDLSYSEIKAVRDAVKQIAHMANAANRLLKNEAFENLEDARAGLRASLRKHFDLGGKKPDFAPGLKSKMIELGQGLLGVHTKPEFLFNYMDGNKAQGLAWKTFMEPMNKAEENEKARNHATAKALDEVFGEYTPQERARWHADKTFIPEIGTSMNKANMLAVGLNQGNEYNRDAVMQGWQWSHEQVNAILDHLDKRDWDTIQKVWRHLDSYWGDIAEQEQAIKGVVPQRVESLAVHTKFGDYEGGYYPIVFDGKYSWRQAQLNEKANAKDMLGGDWAGAQTRHGHTIERTNTGGKPILFQLSGLVNHIAAVNHDLAYRQTIIDINKLANDYDIREDLEKAVGREMARQINPWLRSTAGDRGPGLGGMMEGLLNGLRSGVTTAQLGLHLSTALKHTGNLVSAMNELGPKYWAAGLRDAWARPDQIAKNWEFIASRSPMMKDRAEDFDRDVKDTGRRLGMTQSAGVLPQFMPPEVTKFMMSYLSVTDKFTAMPMWMGAYKKAMEGGHENIQAGDERGAASYADQVVRDYKGAGATKDLAAIQRGNALGKLFTMFYSQLSVQFNQYQKIAHQASFNNREGMGVTENAARTIGAYALQIFPAVAVMALIGHGPRFEDGDDTKDKILHGAKWFALSALDDVAGSVIGLRDMAHGMIQHWETGRKQDFEASPAFSAAQNLMHLVTSDFEDQRAAIDLFGAITGLPTAEAFKAGQRFYDWYTGDNVPSSTMKGIYEALVSGEPRE